jgi:hypothetical protein
LIVDEWWFEFRKAFWEEGLNQIKSGSDKYSEKVRSDGSRRKMVFKEKEKEEEER